MSYGSKGDGTQTAYFNYDIWTPSSNWFEPGSHLTLPNTTGADIFCGSQVVLPFPGAGVFLGGGDNWTGPQPGNTGKETTNTGIINSNLFRYTDNVLVPQNEMQRARWYSTSTVLANGSVYIQGGIGGQPGKPGGVENPEIRSRDGSFDLLEGAYTGGLDFYYPRNFLLSNGKIFGFDSLGSMYFVDPVGAGALRSAGQFSAALAGIDTSATMFRPGHVLQMAGEASNGVIHIDVTDGANPLIRTTQSLSSKRSYLNSTVLPDGRVLATGGSAAQFQLVGVNNSAEIWNPVTDRWTVGSWGALARLYHSVALLMPDGSVLVGGGGAAGPLTNLNAEIYYPPYLFDPSGERAQRPVIYYAPTSASLGQQLPVDVADGDGVRRLSLVKTGAVTHDWNMEQRFIELPFARAGSRLNVHMPDRGGEVPPGNYMLFALDAQGVPSIARMVWINVAGGSSGRPRIDYQPNRYANTGAFVDFTVRASDPNGQGLRFSAAELPPGLAIDPGSGRVSGVPEGPGTFYVAVGASDGFETTTANFVMRVEGRIPAPTLDLLPPATPAVAGSTVSLSASAKGPSPQFKWDFGDGSPQTSFSPNARTEHQYSKPGLYTATVTVTNAGGAEIRSSFQQIVHLPLTAGRPTRSSNIVHGSTPGTPLLWVVNQDNDSVSVFDANGRLAEIRVGSRPRSLAADASGRIWVSNKGSSTLSVIDPAKLSVMRTIALPRASQPFGIAMSPAGDRAYVVLEATGELLRFRTSDFSVASRARLGPNPRHVSISGDGSKAYVSRFITPLQPGESTAKVATRWRGTDTGGEVVVVRTGDMEIASTIVLGHSAGPDNEMQGRGVPNYLGAVAISPDGTQARVPSKQDNIRRGLLRDGAELNFQHTVRAISSRIDLAKNRETRHARIDHDNSSVASAAVYDPLGVFLFVALESSREIAVLDAHLGRELFRFETGRAPQGIALSSDGGTLFVNNFMDRSVGVFDVRSIYDGSARQAEKLDSAISVGESSEKLSPEVLRGKQFFYDARDPRLARDRYMSCASCHNDGGHDGRVWDLTSLGEGLRNTTSLRGRAGGHGFLHWSNNFDEVQDFEGQIRHLAGGSGLMADEQFFAGSRSQALGESKAGISADLDALGAYVKSLDDFDRTPHRKSDRHLTSSARAGRATFQKLQCDTCHAGEGYTGSGSNTLLNIGTLKSTSGSRLHGPLAGIDVPTLRDVWATAPYLHDGSAATLEAAIRAHRGVRISGAELKNLVAFVRAIGREEPKPPRRVGKGTGLSAAYFNNTRFTAPAAARRKEAINFVWDGAPAKGVARNAFSIRWTGSLRAPVTGSYRFRSISNDGIRVRVNNRVLVDRLAKHGGSAVTATSGAVNLRAGKSYPISIEYRYFGGGKATARLQWRPPGDQAFGPVPKDRLSPK